MDEEEIVLNWNKGNFNFVTDNYTSNKFSNIFFIFYYIDCFIQQNLLPKAESLVNLFFQKENNKEEEIIVTNLLKARISFQAGKYTDLELFLKEISDESLPNEWLEYSVKQLKALLLYMKNDFIGAKAKLMSLEDKKQDIRSRFENLNISYYYVLRCLVNWKLGDKNKALQEITISETINLQFNNKSFLASDYFIRGQLFIDLGEFLKGINYFDKAKKLYSEYNETNSLNMVNSAIADIKFIQGKLDEALEMFKDLEKRFEGNEYYLSDITLSIGIIEQKKKNFELAKKNYEKAIEHSKKLNLILYKSIAILSIIDLFVEQNDLENIKRYKAMIEEKSDDKTIQAIQLMTEAQLKQATNELKEAKKLWNYVSDNENLTIYLQLFVMENALKTVILLWKNDRDFTILQEIEKIIEKWEKLANDNLLMPSLATINLLKAKFYIVILQGEEAKKYLNEGLKIAESHGLEVDREDIKKDQERIEKLELIQTMNTNIKEGAEIELDELLDYLKKVKTNVLIEKN